MTTTSGPGPQCKGCLTSYFDLYWKGLDGPWCQSCFIDRFQDDGYWTSGASKDR